jgi:hypothetical protein
VNFSRSNMVAIEGDHGFTTNILAAPQPASFLSFFSCKSQHFHRNIFIYILLLDGCVKLFLSSTENPKKNPNFCNFVEKLFPHQIIIMEFALLLLLSHRCCCCCWLLPLFVSILNKQIKFFFIYIFFASRNLSCKSVVVASYNIFF